MEFGFGRKTRAFLTLSIHVLKDINKEDYEFPFFYRTRIEDFSLLLT